MSSFKFNEAESPVTDALILICEKCGKKISKSDENPAQKLQASLKDELKSRLGKGKVRAVLVGCMDVCPDDEIAIAISRSDALGGKDEFLTLEKGFSNKDARDELIEMATRARTSPTK